MILLHYKANFLSVVEMPDISITLKMSGGLAFFTAVLAIGTWALVTLITTGNMTLQQAGFPAFVLYCVCILAGAAIVTESFQRY